VGDDVRDIAWYRSAADTLYSKVRYTHTGIDIRVITVYGKDDVKNSFLDSIRKMIEESVNFSHGKYTAEVFSAISSPERYRDKLVFVLIYSMDVENYTLCESLSSISDTIYVSVLYPYEASPGNSLYESRTIDSRYQEAFGKRQIEIEMYVRKYGSDIIFLEMGEDISLRFNHFFKHRYA
jgi:uncharacterized protein (DUF58 family)